jgi:hypothetical protein
MRNCCFNPLSFFVILSIILLSVSAANAQSKVSTDKSIYQSRESIQVTFFGAPGDGGDWICIVPTGSHDEEAGDYQYLPQGQTEGVLTFTSPPVGRYEVRAYYNYRSKGYVVAARHAFQVGDDQAAAPYTIASSGDGAGATGSGLGVGYIFSEISGTARPEGGISESVPKKKTYPHISQKELWIAVQDVLDEQGYMFSSDSASGRIKTEPKILGDPDQFAFFGATYSTVVSIRVNELTVSYTARFNKQSNVVMGQNLLEYPKKENELRKKFFELLEDRLSQ